MEVPPVAPKQRGVPRWTVFSLTTTFWKVQAWKVQTPPNWPIGSQGQSLRWWLAPNSINPSVLMGFLLHRREDEFITTIYKRFGEGTSAGFRSSTVKFVPLNCQHSLVFFRALGFIYLEVILFLYPTVPFPDLFKSCVFWKSQEQEQQVQDLKKQINLSKSLIPESPMTRGLNTCSWAYRTFSGGKWWSYPFFSLQKKA